MGIFWDLFQQNQISQQNEKSNNLEKRVFRLEEELSVTRKTLEKTLLALEKHLGKDIDGDGKIS